MKQLQQLQQLRKAAPAAGAVRKAGLFGFGVLLLATSTGCGASLAQPFDQLKASNAKVYIYRLQNFEPPAQQAAASATSLIPPQIQQWVAGAAALLPPGLIPPGLLPGTAAAAATDATAARFRNFRILGWMEIIDSKTLSDTYNVFGKEKNFVSPASTCMYAEFGFSFQPAGGMKNDVLVSLSCNNTQAFDFNWPHQMKTGLASSATTAIIDIAKRTFGG